MQRVWCAGEGGLSRQAASCGTLAERAAVSEISEDHVKVVWVAVAECMLALVTLA